jgi:DNA-binding NtrC family response regulator
VEPSARILIVDDEPQVLNLLRKYLERSGFRVETADSSERALDLVRTSLEGFSLVITDLSLPCMNGEQMLEKMRQSQPDLPALISSGYVHVPKAARTGFLQKPYLPQQLVDAVKTLLSVST